LLLIVQPQADARQEDSEDELLDVEQEPEEHEQQQGAIDSEIDEEPEAELKVHRRPQRAARPPTWMADYVQDYNEEK
jgi:predicted TIM-barrel fold metal-dependent hydrolase